LFFFKVGILPPKNQNRITKVNKHECLHSYFTIDNVIQNSIISDAD